jgi:predicted double-glycine peptidase
MRFFVPDNRQATGFTCGAAAAQAVLGYYGIDRTEDDLAEIMGTDEKDGTAPGNIVRVLLGAGLTVYAGKMTIPLLKRFLDRHIPAILNIQAWTEDPISLPVDYSDQWNDGHYLVATGYDDGNILFSDPALLGNLGYIPEDELDTRWHDVREVGGIRTDHFGIAAFGKKPKFNRDRVQYIQAARVASKWISRA